MNYLSIGSDGKLHFSYFGRDYVIESQAEWDAAVSDAVNNNPDFDEDCTSFQCSSSIDWPEDDTDNQEIIDLCYKIRSW